MNRRFLIPAFLLAMIVAATGIVIWTYDGPASAPQSLSSSQAKLAWQLRSQANTLIQGRKFLEAERVLSRLLKLEPDNVSAQRLLAVCCYENGQYDRAADLFRFFLIRNGGDAAARNNLGMTLIRMRNIEAGITELLRALRRDGKTPYFEYNISRAYRELGRMDKAEEYYLRAVENSKGNSSLPPDVICIPRNNWVAPVQSEVTDEQD